MHDRLVAPVAVQVGVGDVVVDLDAGEGRLVEQRAGAVVEGDDAGRRPGQRLGAEVAGLRHLGEVDVLDGQLGGLLADAGVGRPARGGVPGGDGHQGGEQAQAGESGAVAGGGAHDRATVQNVV